MCAITVIVYFQKYLIAAVRIPADIVPFCGIASQTTEETKTKTKLKVPHGILEHPSVGYAPEPGLKRKNKEIKGGLKVLSERGSIKVKSYKEGRGQVWKVSKTIWVFWYRWYAS